VQVKRRARTTPETQTPWGLTSAQVHTMDALIRLGCNKLVARELGVSTTTVSEHVAGARRHMKVATRVQQVVLFAQWRATNPQPAQQTPFNPATKKD
jgi:DNA-binding NarL/FixJ family response regulator